MASTISAGTTSGTALNMAGDTSGNLAFQTQAGANTISVPNGTGTIAVQGVSTNVVSGTAVASTSGTSIDFTSIPSWVKKITLMFSGVSTNGTSIVLLRLGTSGGVETTGYLGNTLQGNDSAASSGASHASNNGIVVEPATNASAVRHGAITLSLLNSSTNLWVSSGVVGRSDDNSCSMVGGSKALSATLDRVRITTVNGTNTFDAGSINILYE